MGTGRAYPFEPRLCLATIPASKKALEIPAAQETAQARVKCCEAKPQVRSLAVLPIPCHCLPHRKVQQIGAALILPHSVVCMDEKLAIGHRGRVEAENAEAIRGLSSTEWLMHGEL